MLLQLTLKNKVFYKKKKFKLLLWSRYEAETATRAGAGTVT
jgi:hypothetical protein